MALWRSKQTSKTIALRELKLSEFKLNELCEFKLNELSEFVQAAENVSKLSSKDNLQDAKNPFPLKT